MNGTYFVFGQRLDIDHGQLIFDGPIDNPAIDVTALRKNLAVEAGVEVTGTVRVPRVRLVSNPPVPDGEKLSWLMTGQGLDRASRADVAALGAASAMLVGRGQRPLTTTLANSIGLDDISLRERSNAVISGTTSQVVAFGKRINDRLTLVYEQGLTVANNALRIEYALTRFADAARGSGSHLKSWTVFPPQLRLTKLPNTSTPVGGQARRASFPRSPRAIVPLRVPHDHPCRIRSPAGPPS